MGMSLKIPSELVLPFGKAFKDVCMSTNDSFGWNTWSCDSSWSGIRSRSEFLWLLAGSPEEHPITLLHLIFGTLYLCLKNQNDIISL